MFGTGGSRFGIIEGAEPGHRDVQVLVGFALAAMSTAVFIAAQVRGRHPMIPRQLFGSSTVALGLSTALVNMAAFCGVVSSRLTISTSSTAWIFWPPGCIFLPITVLVVMLKSTGVRALERFGKLPTMIGGQGLVAAGLVAISLLPQDAPTIAAALLMVPVGGGGSFTGPPLTALILDHVPADRAGTAAGVLNTARQLGGAIGVAVHGATTSIQPDFISELQLDFLITAFLVVISAAALLPLRDGRIAMTTRPSNL